VGDLTQLRTLNLSANLVSALPSGLSQLRHLQSLNLRANRLSQIPESLRHLTQLQFLDLAINLLSAVPGWLNDMPQLQSLLLSHNELNKLPDNKVLFTQLQSFAVNHNRIAHVPDWLSQLTQLLSLDVSCNQLAALPDKMVQLIQMRSLDLGYNRIRELPAWLGHLKSLQHIVIDGQGSGFPSFLRELRSLEVLSASGCSIEHLPEWIGELGDLKMLYLGDNKLHEVPSAIGQMKQLAQLQLHSNPLNPELQAADREGLDAVKRYLRARGEAQVVLNEAKLILVGEGEVGKSCLLGALRGDEWIENRDTTHGIEIKPIKVVEPFTGITITLNGWDFGGQKVYRPTHQLFFSAPAVYLVVWKPREGSQAGAVKDWIKLVKHREPEAKLLIVATHGGPKDRQPDIDRQELWDLFGKETVIDFFHVDSRPSEENGHAGTRVGECHGIEELKNAIARVAAGLPEMGRTFPKNWQAAREALISRREAYLPFDKVIVICKDSGVDEEDIRLLLRICCRVGDLIHYEHDPLLREIVILKPDWLATAISFVLDDKTTREVGHGLVSFSRLSELWNDAERPAENRYPAELHPIFLRLMERFDLCYRVAQTGRLEAEGTSLIAQLVPDVRPDRVSGWDASPASGDAQQMQICRIRDAANNHSTNAEGLFFQLIVRLHKYSLGRAEFAKSSHWQRGLVLEDDTGARAFLEHVGNDVRITVRSPYPQRFLAALTYEVKWLVESFWEGLCCEVTVPCLTTKANGESCTGLFEVGKLIDNKKRNRAEQPCTVCNEWQSIEQLLHNAPAARANPLEELLVNSAATMRTLEAVRRQLSEQQAQTIGRFDNLNAASKEMVSKVEAAYTSLMQTLLDEAKEGPRLFSIEPKDPGFLDRPGWISARYRVTLWCEHSRLPLPALNGATDRRGVYDLTLPREWVLKAAPFLKLLSGTLGLILPVASSTTKMVLDDATYKTVENQLNVGEKSVIALLKGADKAGEWLGTNDSTGVEKGDAIEAHGSVLRQLQAWLKEKDPTFGGLIRVQNRLHQFLWIHSQFEAEY
jgi:Leucine-rich repeat (LRR) protein